MFHMAQVEDGSIVGYDSSKIVTKLATTAPASLGIGAAVAGAYLVKPVWLGVAGGLVLGSAVGWGILLYWGVNKLSKGSGPDLPDVVVKGGVTYTLDRSKLPQRFYRGNNGVGLSQGMLKMTAD